MTTMRTLKRQARKSATLRGHTLARFHHFSDDTARAHCVNCPCDVQVERFPAPNSIDIGGSAVAVQCEPANWRRLDPHYSGSLAAYASYPGFSFAKRLPGDPEGLKCCAYEPEEETEE